MPQSLFWACIFCVSFALPCVAIQFASAQETQLTEQPPSVAESPERKSLLNELGKLLTAPVELLSRADAPKQEASPNAPLPAPAATPAVETPAVSTRLFPGMVTGRELCPRSANGAPDCQTGSDRLCQSKGYKGGKSLNTDSAFSCSARQARAEGGKPCGNEHFVTSAFCN